MDRVRWGVLGTAAIGVDRVIPAMQAGARCEIVAIASRDGERARAAAQKLGIRRAYDSYQALLDDPEVDAIYNPLPNHLHVEWSIRALDAGKHVLCEKPVAVTAAQARDLLTAARAHPRLKVMESFMYRLHPQWHLTRQMVDEGRIGVLRTVQATFTYHNVDPTDIRNQAAAGGGGLLDVGCYCISASRLIFGAEPQRIVGTVEYDPTFRTDRLASGILDFGRGTATFTCGTQAARLERVSVLGTEGRLELETPFAAPNDRPCRIRLQRGPDVEELLTPVADQYTIQGDLFSEAVLNDGPVPTPLTDAVANMEAIEAVVRSAEQGKWVECGTRNT